MFILSLFSYSLAIIVAFILFLVVKLVIKPKLLLSFYRKQGIVAEYKPLLGHMTRIKSDFRELGDSFGYSKVCAKREPEMPLRAINFGAGVMLALNDPELLKQFFRNNNIYAKYRYFIKPLRLVAGLGILTSDGGHWKKHRKIISNYFHYNFFVENIPLIRNAVVEFFDELKKTDMKKVHIMDEIQLISGEIVGRLFFSEKLYHIKMKKTGRPIQLEMAYLISDLSSAARNFIPALFGSSIIAKGWFKEHKDILDRRQEVMDVLIDLIGKRKESKVAKNDLLDLLIQTQQNPDPANAMTDQDIIDEFFTFVAAGMDTTGHLFTMSLYCLMLHPEHTEELMSEIKQYYDTNNIDAENLKKMDFMTAFIKECLRMYSPVPAPMPMEATTDHKLGNFSIKKGTIIRPDYFFNNFNERYFKDPYTFNPRRWYEKEVMELNPYVYIPFSAGPRNCIGQHLAMIEAKIMISEFLNRFNYKCSEENYDPKFIMRMLYEPVPNYLIDLTPK